MHAVQITPTFPPNISGVGDYVALLAKGARATGWPLTTLVAGLGRASRTPSAEASILEQTDADALARALNRASTVLLHFSGYGYARRGLCRWLVDGLAEWKARGEGRRLVTMFHEVYASGPIWRSSFWTAPAQQRIARDLGLLSDAAFVSSGGGLAQLAHLVQVMDVELLPVFSNVGEPEAPKKLSERTDRAVLFGSKARRRKVYDALELADSMMARRLEELGIRLIVDVGPEMDIPDKIAGCRVDTFGPRHAEEVSAILADARIGLVDYPGHVFTKSGIAAAYFAHRLAVLNTSFVGGFPPDLKDGRHFMGLKTFARGDVDPQTVADAGHAWYQPHGVAATVEKFRAALG